MEEGRREKKTGKESISILINRTTHHQRSSWKLLSISCDIGRCYVIKKHSSNPILGPGQEGPLTWDLTGRGLPSSSLSCALWDKESTDPKGLVYSEHTLVPLAYTLHIQRALMLIGEGAWMWMHNWGFTHV